MSYGTRIGAVRGPLASTDRDDRGGEMAEGTELGEDRHRRGVDRSVRGDDQEHLPSAGGEGEEHSRAHEPGSVDDYTVVREDPRTHRLQEEAYRRRGEHPTTEDDRRPHERRERDGQRVSGDDRDVRPGEPARNTGDQEERWASIDGRLRPLQEHTGTAPGNHGYARRSSRHELARKIDAHRPDRADGQDRARGLVDRDHAHRHLHAAQREERAYAR